MEARIYGVRSAVATPLRAGEYRARLTRVLSLAKQNTFGDAEDFLSSLEVDLQRIVGGNTACLSVVSGDGTVLVLDAGSGLFALGQRLMQGPCGKGQGEIHIFFSHLHWDRISGLFHFAPLYEQGNQIHFYFPEENLDLRLIRLFSPPYHEHPLDSVPADLHFHTLQESSALQIGNTSIGYAVLLHPGGSYAYRLEEGKACLVYAGGGKLQEAFYKSESHPFLSGVQALFLDARPDASFGLRTTSWGHTDYKTAVEIASLCKAEHLFLFNHPPELEDQSLWQAFLKARDLQFAGGSLQVHLAREGQRIRVGLE